MGKMGWGRGREWRVGMRGWVQGDGEGGWVQGDGEGGWEEGVGKEGGYKDMSMRHGQVQ